jgi:hypothetical protein
MHADGIRAEPHCGVDAPQGFYTAQALGPEIRLLFEQQDAILGITRPCEGDFEHLSGGAVEANRIEKTRFQEPSLAKFHAFLKSLIEDGYASPEQAFSKCCAG